MYTLFETIYLEEVYTITPQVTVVLPVPWVNVKEDEKILLSKILQAVRQGLDSVTIRHQLTFDMSDWIEKPARVLCFSPAEGLPKFEVLPAHSTSVIVSSPLPELITNDDAKKKLWAALKVMFSPS